MRHALMAEQKKSEIHEKIKSLTAECENLEEMVDQLNQDAVDMKKADDEEREVIIQEHIDWKKESAQRIYVIKDDLDTVLSNPNMIA